jgi:hypothetical protein
MVMSQTPLSQEGPDAANGTSGGQPPPAWPAGPPINQGTSSSEQLVANNGQPDRAGPALKRLRDDPVLGYDCDEANKATRKRAAWRQVVLSRARRARHELLSAWAATPPGPGQDRWGEEPAELILKATQSALQRVSPWAWLEGCYQEQAWLALHEADAQIIEVLPPEELLAHADGVLAKARSALGAEDPRVKCIESLLCEDAPSESKLRPRLAHLARETFDTLDDKYAQSRGYRNRLIRLTSLASAGIALAIIGGTMSQLNFRLINEPDARGWRIVVLIMLFGSVGALVTAIPPLAKANGVRNPFSLPFFQLLLKLAMGPLFAIVGVLILQNQLINGLKPAEDLGGLLVWATLFGAAQQSVTRFIDKRVNGLLGEMPEADSSKKPVTAKPPRK